ncbi:MAG: hypothetical protein K2K23_02745, partial [Muribaculaceae bacterium]|nr:hypothetical protein [Muribaculaceae bacterium]
REFKNMSLDNSTQSCAMSGNIDKLDRSISKKVKAAGERTFLSVECKQCQRNVFPPPFFITDNIVEILQSDYSVYIPD